MNMTGITSNIAASTVLSKPVAANTEKALSSVQENVEDPREARAKAFYTREAEPWKGMFYTYSELGKPEEQRPCTKEMYLNHLKSCSRIELMIQECFYSEIRNEIGVFRPELAQKNFSYTLDDDATIKILDPDQSLDEGELRYLTNLFNEQRGFGKQRGFVNSVVNHAKMAMAMVDHDDKAFGGKYKLDLLNIQHTLDYGKLVLQKPEKMYEAFIRQILDNGHKREEPLIDTVA